eukprot:jgi/Tetstr1/438817/TSEL_027326.t1
MISSTKEIVLRSTLQVAMATGSDVRLPRVAVGQMTSIDSKEENFKTCAKLAQDAAAAGCCALFLPECFSFLGKSWQESLAAAEPLDGPTVRRYQELARNTKLWLSLGGFQQKCDSIPDKLLNAHVVIDAEGKLVASYAKVHLFNVDIPNGPVLMESRFTAPGDRLVCADSPAGRVGLTVCYDLRFPEVYQTLAHEHGAIIMTVPSAFTKPTGEAHWEVLLRARAIETQSYVIAAAQAGRHNEKRESFGHAIVVDPWGSIVAALSDPLATGIAVAEIDAAKLDSIRTRMPIKEHREAGRAALGLP